MATNNPASVLIEAVRKAVTGKPGKELAALLLENAPPDDLQGASPEILAQLVGGRLAFLNERKPGRAKIAVVNPEGALSGITTIDIVNDDMPFLVDSTIGLLAERGHEVRLALHPVVAVKRDASGKLLDLDGKACSRRDDGPRELHPYPSRAPCAG